MFEYVASGTSHLCYNRASLNPERIFPLMNDLINFIKNDLQSHEVSFLFNAYTEPKLGEVMKTHLHSLHNIHSDSGGLQIVTQGKTVTDDIKQRIYKTQNAFSDVGMCFDEIPVSFLGETGGGMNDNNMRYFDIEKFEHTARQTGKNIREQIEFFVNDGIKCKPMLIVHGNTMQNMCRWTDYVLDEIPNDMHQYIHGIATSGVSLGTGPLQDIYRAAITTYLDIDEKLKRNIHMLGVGSITRMIPVIELFKTQYIANNTHISYDSSSHTMKASQASFMCSNLTSRSITNSVKYKKQALDYFKQYHQHVCNKYDINLDECIEYMTVSDKINHEYGGKRSEDFILMKSILVFTNIYHFIKKLDAYIKDNQTDPKYTILSNVKTKEDFDYYHNDLIKYTKTRPIPHSKPISLWDF